MEHASISLADLTRHVYVIGSSGTGKTSLLVNMIAQAQEKGYCVHVIDPNGDMAYDLVECLHERLLTITRVIVHPKYRTIGLGAKLVRETLPLAGSPYVEMIAVMARYNPFAEKAGMVKVAEKEPDERLLNFQKSLEKFGFNRYLLSSVSYNISMLRKLGRQQVKRIKRALTDCHHFFLL